MHQSDISIWPQVNFSQLESSVGLEPHCGAVGCMAEEEKIFFPAFHCVVRMYIQPKFRPFL